MKDTHIFYGVCVIATLVVGLIGIGYATDVLPLYKQSRTTPQPVATDTVSTAPSQKTTTVNPRGKRKNCACCAEKAAKMQERIEKIRSKKKAPPAADPMVSQ